MKVYLAAPRGFCAGVDRAIDVVEIALDRFGPPVYLKHEIVHNSSVVKSLEARGAVTVEDVRDIPEGANVVFSAHGSGPDDFRAARERNLNVIDATCPLVTKVHNEALKYSREGRKIILVGHRGHQEVKGTMGQAPMTLLDDREELDLPDWGRVDRGRRAHPDHAVGGRHAPLDRGRSRSASRASSSATTSATRRRTARPP